MQATIDYEEFLAISRMDGNERLYMFQLLGSSRQDKALLMVFRYTGHKYTNCVKFTCAFILVRVLAEDVFTSKKHTDVG